MRPRPTARPLGLLLLAGLLVGAATAPPATLEQGEHAGTVTIGVVETVAVELDGSQARAQLRYDLPDGAEGLTSTLRWSPATAPDLTCTRNESALDGSLDDRTALDSRRTDTPDPADPCTQPGRHLLDILVQDPGSSIPEGTTVPYTLVLSVFGGPADLAAAEAVATESPAPTTGPATAQAGTEDGTAEDDPAVDGLPAPVLAAVVAVTLLALLATRMRRTWRAAGGDTVLVEDGIDDAVVPRGVPDEAFVRPDLGSTPRSRPDDPDDRVSGG